MLACPVVSGGFQPCCVTWLQMCAQLPYNQGPGSRGLMHLVCVVYGKNDVLHHSLTHIQYHRWLHHGPSLSVCCFLTGIKGCQFRKCRTPCMCGRVSLSEPKLFLPGQNFQFNTNLNIYMIWSSHE